MPLLILYIDASGNPVTQSVIGVTDASGNPVTGKLLFYFIYKPLTDICIFKTKI